MDPCDPKRSVPTAEVDGRSAVGDPPDYHLLASVFASHPDSVSVLDPDLTIRLVNPANAREVPHAGTFVGRKCYEAFRAQTQPCDRCPCQEALTTGKPQRERAPLFDEAGAVVGTMELFGFPLLDAETAEAYGVIEHARNITREVELEEKLRAATRREALGRLAGGIAHDFNNLLAIILNYATFVADELPEASPVRADVEEIREAGERAVGLTRRLLAFSGRDILNPATFDPNATIRGSEELLVRTAGEGVRLSLQLAEPIWPVVADPARFVQTLVELVANARDAMVDGGTVVIETCQVQVERLEASALSPGRYVRVSVTDTGCGMPPDVAARALEPFFTTKPQGQGVGLGLASAFGSALQTGGNLSFHTSPGVGTTFEVHLPAASAEALPDAGSETSSGRAQTILVVDDEEGLRKLTTRILKRHGYNVVVAADGEEATAAWQRLPGPLDLLLTDVIMPRMSGRVIAQKLCALQPGLKVLYMSGYDDQTIERTGVVEPGAVFLYKPFTADELLARVRELIGELVATTNP